MAKRLTKAARREQLLDVAVEIIVDRGTAALTMEGLAANAGVSKAVPYHHFENSDAVLIALYQREMVGLAGSVVDAVDAEDLPVERLRAAIHAYFDVIIERGTILAPLVAPGSSIAELADGGGRDGHRFITDLLRRALGMHAREAALTTSLLIGLLNGAADALAHRVAGRGAIEARVFEACLLLTGLADRAVAPVAAR